jgi:hypothetical protein
LAIRHTYGDADGPLGSCWVVLIDEEALLGVDAEADEGDEVLVVHAADDVHLGAELAAGAELLVGGVVEDPCEMLGTRWEGQISLSTPPILRSMCFRTCKSGTARVRV